MGRKFESYLGSKLKEMILLSPFFLAAMFYIYILHSQKADKFYIGYSPDVFKRLREHNNPLSGSKFTAKYLPWNLVCYFSVSDSRGDALKVERFIKKQKSKQFIQKHAPV